MDRSLRTSFALLALVAVACGPAKAAAAGSFLPHQALYELSLVKSRGSNPVNSARGRILYNFSGSACEGYTSEFRQVSELEIGEGKMMLSDLRSSSWEDGEGKSYRFKIDARTNDNDPNPVDGIAERTGDKITVKLKQPEAKTFTLDHTYTTPGNYVVGVTIIDSQGGQGHGYFAVFLAPYKLRDCLRPSTPSVSSAPRTIW